MISIIIRNKFNANALFYLILLLMVPIAILIVIILLAIQAKNNILSIFSEIWFVLLVLVFFTIYVLDSISWQFRGYEEIEFDNLYFKRIRKGKLLSDKFMILTNEIYSIEEQEYVPEEFRTHFFRNPFLFSKVIGETGGRILIRYGKNGKKKFDFGLGLSSYEAKQYVKQMNDILKAN